MLGVSMLGLELGLVLGLGSALEREVLERDRGTRDIRRERERGTKYNRERERKRERGTSDIRRERGVLET